MSELFTITDEAKSYIAELLGQYPGKSLMVGINNKGCGGHKYEYGLIDRGTHGEHDEVMDWDGGSLVVDAHSVMWMIGSQLTLESTPWDQRLSWVNPMATATCGCGESFSLAGSGGCGS